jgi:hypothetical protein
MPDSMWVQLLAPAFKVLFLSVSLVGIGLGVCLIVRGEATLRIMHGMNHWVSSRRAMKPLEIPHNVEPVARTGRRGIGIVVAAVGIYAFIVLILQFDPGKLASVLGQHPRYSIAAVAIESLRWLLIAGSALAAVIGVMMLVAPRALGALESVGNRWISTRRLVAGGDTMHVPLDRFAEHHPRVAGVLIAGLSLAATVASVLLLLG